MILHYSILLICKLCRFVKYRIWNCNLANIMQKGTSIYQ